MVRSFSRKPQNHQGWFQHTNTEKLSKLAYSVILVIFRSVNFSDLKKTSHISASVWAHDCQSVLGTDWTKSALVQFSPGAFRGSKDGQSLFLRSYHFCFYLSYFWNRNSNSWGFHTTLPSSAEWKINKCHCWVVSFVLSSFCLNLEEAWIHMKGATTGKIRLITSLKNKHMDMTTCVKRTQLKMNSTTTKKKLSKKQESNTSSVFRWKLKQAALHPELTQF